MDGIIGQLPAGGNAPFIANPVNPGEDLGAKLDDYSRVRNFFVDTKAALAAAVADDDAYALGVIFGPGFSYTATQKASSYVAPAAAVQPTRAYGVSDGETHGC